MAGGRGGRKPVSRSQEGDEPLAESQEHTYVVSRSEYFMLKRKFSLFWPHNKSDLLNDYTELRRLKVFTDLEPRKMLFVWFYSCRISPIVQGIQDDTQRIEEAIKEAWGKNPSKEIKEKYLMRQWGPEMSRAITAMRGYIPGVRIRMKLLMTETVDKVQALLDADVSGLNTWTQKREYFDAVAAANKLFKEMLPMLEEGAMGVVDVDQIEYADGEAMAEIMNEINVDE